MPHPQATRPHTQHFGGNRQPKRAENNQLPESHPVSFFKDSPAKKQIDPILLDKRASDLAASFKKLKTTQMRRFYDELKAIERKVFMGKDAQTQEANFQNDRAMIVLFKAKAVYSEKRLVSPRAFTQFIFDHIDSIKDARDFQAFLKVFEAVVAFHRFFSEEN